MTQSVAGAPRRVLVINPNTNPLVTARVMAVCERYAGPSLQFEVTNPSSGPFSIESDADKEEAEAQVLRLMSERAAEQHDAYVLACFDDLGLNAARQMLSGPVIGCCEAGIAAARTVSPALAIVTTVTAALPGIRSMMRRYGAGAQATVRAAGVGVDEAARAQPDVRARLLRAMEDAVRVDGAKVILLASGGLTGQAKALGRDAGVPVIDAVEAALCLAGQVSPSEL
jgi:allantoin racemase